MLIAAVVATAVALAAAAGWVLARQRAAAAERESAHHLAQLERLQTTFARFAPEEVVERLAGGRAVEAKKMDVTVLFADLRGFTQMSEALDPETLVEVLNGYFRVMSDAITRNHGLVSKFIGDGLLAIFGALKPNPWHAADAVRAALDMRAALERYNDDLARAGHARLAFGVGIHRGEAVAGVIGNDTLREFTVIGDTVNLASRVETLTRIHGVDLLVTRSVREALDERFRVEAMPLSEVKGKSAPVETFAVTGVANE